MAVSVARKSWFRVDTAICLLVVEAVDAGDAWASPIGSRIAAGAVTARTSPATRERSLFILAFLCCLVFRELRRQAGSGGPAELLIRPLLGPPTPWAGPRPRLRGRPVRASSGSWFFPGPGDRAKMS